jgi:4-alpha-glucanotransferase
LPSDRRLAKQAKELWLQQYASSRWQQAQHALDAFCQRHPWALSYAEFKALKEMKGGSDCRTWSKRDTERPPKERVGIHLYLQMLAYEQMEEVKRRADQKGVLLQGDFPILVSPDSADVWENRDAFDLSLSAGAPPDLFNLEGQKWGYPLLTEPALLSWWKRRLEAASSLYHLYRIDHVVGLFRIWAIPEGRSAKEGYFFPADPAVWEPRGRRSLEALLALSPLLPIGEDLGTVPPLVRRALSALGICSTKVVRWEKGVQGYLPFQEYEPYSLTTLSTQDLTSFAAWWAESPQEASQLAHLVKIPYLSPLPFEALVHLLRAVHATPSYFHINWLFDYLAPFPELAHPPPLDRINIPGTLSPTNWTYRFRPSIEQLVEHRPLAEMMKRIIE